MSAPHNMKTEIPKEIRNWAMFCHIAIFAGLIIPFGNIIGPLILWLIKKDEYDFVNFHGKQVLNFQITMTLASILCWALMFIIIGFILLPALLLFILIVTIIATIKTSEGDYYHYPLAIRFFK